MRSTYHDQFDIIDLSQEIYEGMPVFGMHQKTFFMLNQTHEKNMKDTGSKTLGFAARNMLISEHGPTHSDAVWEYEPSGPTIEKMDLHLFWGDALCVDVSHIRYPQYIEIDDLKTALDRHHLTLQKGDIFLMYTGHYDRTYPDKDYGGMNSRHTGVSYGAARWLAENGVVNIGADAPAIDQTPDDLDFSGHLVCGEFGITNTENLCNLDKVAGKRFLYMGLPLRIRDGSGSPIRAVAMISKN
jgi:kynurenine formamidase